jgi:Skp family chaperone for outer membrane proteins
MRDLLRGGGVLLLLGVLVLTGRSWSDARPAPPRPQARVAVVNLTYVLKHYEKFPVFQQDLKEAVKPYQKKDEELKKKAEALTKGAASPNTTEERKAAIEKKLKVLQRELEDNKTEAQALLSKKQEKQLKVLYEDVESATRRYARAHDIELVLHYNDAVTRADLYHPNNITRKMQQGGCMPLYSAPGVDISKEIARALNEALRRREL